MHFISCNATINACMHASIVHDVSIPGTPSDILIKIHAHEQRLRDPHKLGHERLEVENHLCSLPDPVFVKRSPLDHLCLQRLVDLRHELED